MTRPLLMDEADFVIVGTGAGGATAARVLAGAGHSVVLLEEGPDLKLAERPRELLAAVRDVLRDGAALVARGPTPISVLQGSLVGGSTAINSGIIWRLPEPVRRAWADDHGLDELLESVAMDRVYDQIEDELGVAPTAEDVLGGNAAALREGARALGLPGGSVIRRNAPGCRGAARCFQGCPNLAKQSMDLSYVPRAKADGARLHASARVRRVRLHHGRAVGVEGELLEAGTRRPRGRFEVRARRGVIVAAGAVHTPVILQRSGLRGLTGHRFQAHPGTAVVGRFPEPVAMGFGATQSYQVAALDDGFKIESLTLPPEMLASRLPGAGPEWQARLVDLDHYAQWAAAVRMEALGRVRWVPGLGVDVRYVPTARDLEVTRQALALSARMMFAAGATEVYPGMKGRPAVLTDPAQVRLLEEGPVTPASFTMVASHLFGTACAGRDPARSVVRPDLRAHAVPGLYVMDASVFPTNTGVNPQHAIMALVWRAAERLAEAARPRAAAA